MEKRELADAGRSAGPSCAIIDSQSVKLLQPPKNVELMAEKTRSAGRVRPANYFLDEHDAEKVMKFYSRFRRERP
ncbi:MAG: hypothetical protein HFF66_10595 [Oscillospiraceae bacterium]|jgi:hypothetical protein|nr:hypothetical protein [Oscillospiraceae bacterium]